MRKKTAFTLIELIFSMVIIAIAFTVLPKILQLAAKVSVQNVREEAMYNAVAYIGLIKSTAWDENNTQVDDILHVSSAGDSDYDCNSSASNPIRKGGFTGSRNCKNDKNASITLGMESNDNNIYDDMDDFNDVNTSATNYNSSRDYNLSVTVKYVKDINESDDTFPSSEKSDSTNTKEINVTVEVNTKKSALGTSLVRMSFTAQNIGQQRINRRNWN